MPDNNGYFGRERYEQPAGAAESVGEGCGAMAGVDNLPTSHTAPPMSRPARHSVRIIHLSDFCNICPPLPR